MVTIRVTGLTSRTDEKHLKTYFKNPKYGGGNIKSLYYPLNHNEAVVVFENAPNDDDRLKILISTEHFINDQPASVKIEPPQMFQAVSARLINPAICNLLKNYSQLLDDLKYGSDLEVSFNDQQQYYTMTGNIYQIEWAWAFLNHQTPSKYKKEDKSPTYDDAGYILPSHGTRPSEASRSATLGGQAPTQMYTNIQTPAEIERMKQRRATLPDIPLPATPDTPVDSHIYDSVRSVRSVNPSVRASVANPERGAFSYGPTTPSELGPRSGEQPIIHTMKTKTTSKSSSKIKTFDLQNMMTLYVYEKDITKSETVAIVVSTDPAMRHATGIPKVIAGKAGKKYKEEVARILKYKTELKFCDVTHTCAGGDLHKNMKYIIHVCLPPWDRKDSDIQQHKLVETYCRILQYADETLKVKSLTTSFLGTGTSNIPMGVSVSTFLDAAHIFVSKCQSKPTLKEIHLVSIDEEQVEEALTTLTTFTEMKFHEYLALALEKYDDKLLDKLFPKPVSGGAQSEGSNAVYLTMARLSRNLSVSSN